MQQEDLIQRGKEWFKTKDWQPFAFQLATWEAYFQGYSGLVNAPTGSGKTYSLLLPILLESFLHNKTNNKGLQAIWITPIRALTKEIQSSATKAAQGLGLDWQVGIRSGDTKQSERQKQKRKPPQILITTPESLHLLLASKGYAKYFKNLKCIVVDEWHELIGSKRGVQMELALSRLKGLLPELKVWGISATIGNMEEALEVLHGKQYHEQEIRIIKAATAKKIEVETLLPQEIEKFPWAGHLGIKMIEQVVPIVKAGKSTLIFTNTRAQCEIWYQQLLAVDEDLAGLIAMHHSSLDRELRDWVENALHNEQLKGVVCTSSLDLGVDFRPVENIVQIGSPKGIARFLQRAGRSGHQPGAISKIYFVPTHSLELIEASAIRAAIKEKKLESRIPYIRSFDTLLQYLVTLAVSDGFSPIEILPEVRSTFSFSSITDQEWNWCLSFITTGGEALGAYDEHQKVIVENGIYKVESKKIALRHRLSIGTISSSEALMVKYVSGGKIGTVEEWFISQLNPGDTFWFSGKSLEFVRIKDMTVQVRKSKNKKGKVPSWMGGKIEFSSSLSTELRIKIDQLARQDIGNLKTEPELHKIMPLIELQAKRSHVPTAQEFLIEYFKDREGYHLAMYPYEGYYIHEGMSALIAYRIAQLQPISFSIALNDYGFELLSDIEIPIRKALKENLFSTDNLMTDIEKAINAAEIAKRKFRDIAHISGLIFRGFPGKKKKDRHLQASSQLFFQVFHDYEPENLLLLQAYDEVMTFQIQQARLRTALKRLQSLKVVLSEPKKATPFIFPIMVDRLRGTLTSEKLEDRVKKMKLRLVRD